MGTLKHYERAVVFNSTPYGYVDYYQYFDGASVGRWTQEYLAVLIETEMISYDKDKYSSTDFSIPTSDGVAAVKRAVVDLNQMKDHITIDGSIANDEQLPARAYKSTTTTSTISATATSFTLTNASNFNVGDLILVNDSQSVTYGASQTQPVATGEVMRIINKIGSTVYVVRNYVRSLAYLDSNYTIGGIAHTGTVTVTNLSGTCFEKKCLLDVMISHGKVDGDNKPDGFVKLVLRGCVYNFYISKTAFKDNKNDDAGAELDNDGVARGFPTSYVFTISGFIGIDVEKLGM